MAPPVPPEAVPPEDAAERFMQARLGSITARILLEVEWQLLHAPPAARREILKSVVPHLFRAQQEKTADDEIQELRDQLRVQNEQLVALMYNRQVELPSAADPTTPTTPTTPAPAVPSPPSPPVDQAG